MKDIANIAERCGFDLISSEELPEIEGSAYTLAHKASGAKLLYLQNDDPNKSFSISFKTPAGDDTGVFHILEHSVLCGSRKFPVKEPFVNLLKSSMQTFLNAMTFPDKTMYPVASTNEQDLMNLTDVYLDAVFYPAIYEKEAIFEQEGWHFELADDTDDTADVTCNGVVYNEMKGALSDPDAILFDTLSAALFPDTTYRFESGGTPESIPDLTYEAFLDNHRRHYRVDNSYLTLYGDLDLEKFLSFIDEAYLTPLAGEQSTENAGRGCASTDAQSPLREPNPLNEQTPVVNTGIKRRMITAPENACEALGFVVGRVRERKRVLAAGILIDAIMGSNEAPLKRALLDADIAADANGFVNGDCCQPFVVVQLQGLKHEASGRLWEIVEQTVQELADGALDHELLEAALSHAEFVMRESNFGVADGVVLSMMALSGWLYDDGLSTTYLHYEEAFDQLREQIDQGYFEQLLREIFLENDHYAYVEVIPCEHGEIPDEDQRLHEISQTISSGKRQEIKRVAQQLREAQEKPDEPQDLAKLPKLSISDICKAPKEGDFKLEDVSDISVLRHYITTHGIAYAYRYFDLNRVLFEDLPYVKILSMVLGKLDTAHHSASEIDTLVQSKLGNLNFYTQIHEDAHSYDAYTPKFVVSTSALSHNVTYMATIINEILRESDFSDHAKILDILMQQRIAMEQDFAVAGQSVALARVASYYRQSALINEQLGGMDFYFFLKDACEHFEERADLLETKLRELAQMIFVDGSCLLSFAGSDDDLARLVNAGLSLGSSSQTAANAEDGQRLLVVPSPRDRHEAFVVPSDISFTAMGCDAHLCATAYSGAWLVASRALSYDYLWNEVRVKGGAYGAGFAMSRSGLMHFYSYRDPHVDETLQRFCESGKWLSAFSPEPFEMDGYVVSTTAGLDAPLKPRALLSRQDGMFFSNYTPQERLSVRDEVLETTADNVRALGDALVRATDCRLICTVGGRELIDHSNEEFNIVNLFE